ncbi:DNA-binding protein [Lachnellula suecica]|uniref:DNA-binding protein n=1 Tax=Lachnellula suecica TaxID=602035 RepID=A0A8T9CDP8_9HELO|nr:DNA-binding protein [Lachnellula suecica]
MPKCIVLNILTDGALFRSEKPGSSNSRPRVEELAGQAEVTAAVDRKTDTEARQSILNQILEPEAADRLGRIRLVKESRAADVENRLIMLARSGQLRSKVTEEQLKELLNAVAEKKEEEKIVVSRRKGGWDDDDDDLLDL